MNRCRQCNKRIKAGLQFCSVQHANRFLYLQRRFYGKPDALDTHEDGIVQPKGCRSVEEFLSKGGVIRRFEALPLPMMANPVRPKAAMLGYGQVRR